MIDTMMRCHIKSEKRYELFVKAVDSWFAKGLNGLGKLTVVDDQSPEEFRKKVEAFCSARKIKYKRTSHTPGTINGLYHSLKFAKTKPVLCCVDDVVFGQGIKEELERIVRDVIPFMNEQPLNRYAAIGMFACYNKSERMEFHNTRLWNIANDWVYALVCHIFPPDFSNILIEQYEKKLNAPDALTDEDNIFLGYQDDIWVARNATKHGYIFLNTIPGDYAWHTGTFVRSFTNDENEGSSNYQTPCFVGE